MKNLLISIIILVAMLIVLPSWSVPPPDEFARSGIAVGVVVEDLPSARRVSLLKQEKQNRYVAHLLYAPALQRGEVMVIEDFLPVPGVEIEVNVPEKVKKVYQIPDGKKVDFTRKGNKLIVKVPTFTMHSGIIFEY